VTQPTVSEARRYQQLRAHMGYLKLNDAADALPRVLDAARAERLTLTAALERRLEIEVEAATLPRCGSSNASRPDLGIVTPRGRSAKIHWGGDA
jgi:hypothetical protein